MRGTSTVVGAPLAVPAFVRALVVAAALLGGASLSACKDQPLRAPGETTIRIAEVTIRPLDPGAPLALPHGDLFERLGMRPGSALLTERTYSPFREAEDRRRIEAYWQQRGYFDVVVSPAEVAFDPGEGGKARVTFRVRENARYRIGEVYVTRAPPAEEAALSSRVPFGRGHAEVDLEAHRGVRIELQDHLRRAGYGHANVLSRFYVDRAKKVVHVYYFVDAGPKTRIASVKVQGNVKVPSAAILRRSGLAVGEPYAEGLRDEVVRDLMDTGAFSAAFVRVDTDTKFIPPGTAPDSGGELKDEQVSDSGELVPRELPEGVNVIVHVVEAPSAAARLRAAGEIDPARADATLGGSLALRNALGTYRHVVLEGRAGYGVLFGDAAEIASAERSGPFGDATARVVSAGALGRLGDARLTARYRGDLFPGAFLHRAEAGPGVRATLDTGLYLDFDVFATWALASDYGPFTAAEIEALSLPVARESTGAEADLGIVLDRRDDPLEPMRGHFVALTTRFAPGGPLGTHRFLNVAPDARAFLPLGPSVSLGFRASGEFSFLPDEAGVPLHARLFGGGAYGFRGHGRQRLSPTVTRCVEASCADVPVGGLGLVEASVEARLLPPRKQYGAVLFADLGGASGELDPFALGASFAAGLGLRLRLWYLPLAADLAWRVVGEGDVQAWDDEPLQAFLRIGEAF